MKITVREDTAASLMDEMRQSFGSGGRPTLHLSDLLQPRKAFWQRVLPKPATDDEVVYFLSGRGYEDAYGRIVGLERGRPAEAFGITFTVDFYRGTFAELKTRRRDLAPPERIADDYSHYIAQCKGYCAFIRGAVQQGVAMDPRWMLVDPDNLRRCELLVFTTAQQQPDGTTKPDFQVIDLEFTEQELDDWLVELLQRAGNLDVMLARVLSPGPPAGTKLKHECSRFLPLCSAWMCGKRSREMTTKPLCQTCAKDFQTDWGIDKHVSSRTGAGHAVTKAEYRYFYRPRCKYYDDCQPYVDDPTRGGERGEGPTTEDGAE